MSGVSFLLLCLVCLFSCESKPGNYGTVVNNSTDLREAIEAAEPGAEIVLANGVWDNTQIKLYGKGTEAAPITLRAETPGEVFLEGESSLHLGGEYLVVKGLFFRNGYSPGGGVIRYQIGEDSTANHCRVTECVIDGFTQPNRWVKDRWVEFFGKHNQLDRCYIAGKANDGATLTVYQKGNQHTNNYHQIVNNHFGPRPRKAGPRGETMRIGESGTSMTPGRVNVSGNYFEACNGEVEVISDKTNFNSFTNNIFYKCEGSLVMRHSNYTTVDGNIFIGDDDSDFYGGIRAVNTGHWITNNYFYKIRGEQFRSPLALMNGIPKSPQNRYNQVTDVVVAHNTWVDCRSPWQIGVGQNKASADVLPKSEIRSAPPIRTTVANNIIYNTHEDAAPVVNHDVLEGVLFRSNVIDNNGTEYTEYDVARNGRVEMQQINDWLFVPADDQEELLGDVYPGYDFERIEKDMFGSSWSENKRVGAVGSVSAAEGFQIDPSRYGPQWYDRDEGEKAPETHSASAAQAELARVIGQASAGDIIELADGEYEISSSLVIDKEITLRGTTTERVVLNYVGADNSPAFAMHPGGNLRLRNVALRGTGDQRAFAPLAENMSSNYKLDLENSAVQNFAYVLEATRGSLADSLQIRESVISDCTNGIVLAAEEKGNYNAEMIIIRDSEFRDIERNIIHYYRGGYDESTIGGSLSLSLNTFTRCGQGEASGVLIKTRGIHNVYMLGNDFRNNPVRHVAVLWGEKNNHHEKNTVTASGFIKVEQQQALELMY